MTSALALAAVITTPLMSVVPAASAHALAPVQSTPPRVQGLMPAIARPVIVRGGVLMLPIMAEARGVGWPDRLRLVFDSGDELEAPLVRVVPTLTPATSWTSTPGLPVVEQVQPGMDAMAGGAGVFALVELPPSLSGDFRLAAPVTDGRAVQRSRTSGDEPILVESRAVVRPVWVERPPAPWPDAPVMELEEGPGWPDARSPFEWWRWTLLARRRRVQPPEPAGDAIEALIARHVADLWAVGLARLARQSEGVAAECLELLTNTCRDGDVEIATWVVDPIEVASLLNMLLDFNRLDRSVMEGALTWARSQAQEVVWVESAGPRDVTIVVANPGVAELYCEALWFAGAHAVGEPTPTILEPRTLTRVRLQRPQVNHISNQGPSHGPGPGPSSAPLLGVGAGAPAPLALVLSIEGREIAVALPPALLSATPPALVMPPLRPALTLAEARRPSVATPVRSTIVMLRRTRGRWELFAECAVPESTSPRADAMTDVSASALDDPGAAPDDRLLERFARSSGTEATVPDTLLPIGREAVTLLIGPRDAQSIILCVPEQGEPWMPLGGRPADWPDLSVHRHVTAKGWRVRIVVPEEWVSPLVATAFPLAIVRTHGGSEIAEFSGPPPVPWALRPAPVTVDLGAWTGFGRNGSH